MSIAYWISPDGEIIEVKKGNHIAEIIANPEKFGFTEEFIKFVFNNYNEKMGQEGKARKQLMIALFDNHWIRIRKYREFWSINVKKNTDKLNFYINQWAKKILKGLHGFKEKDPYISIKIDQKNQKSQIIELKPMAETGKFVPKYMLTEKTIVELPDLKPYNFINEIMAHGIKQRPFNEYLTDETNKKMLMINN